MALKSKIYTIPVLEIIDNTTFSRKKRSEKGTIVHYANAILGLDADETAVNVQHLEVEIF